MWWIRDESMTYLRVEEIESKIEVGEKCVVCVVSVFVEVWVNGDERGKKKNVGMKKINLLMREEDRLILKGVCCRAILGGDFQAPS